MDYFELDFLKVESAKSGDAIAIRYTVNGITRIHVVDGGFLETGTDLVEHIRTYYGAPTYIDNVVVTHPDGDHAAGVRKVLEEFSVGALWMHRPWLYVTEIISGFANVTSEKYLEQKLRSEYSNIDILEKMAIERGIPMFEPFQGAQIGEFKVLAPSRARYLQLIIDSEKTPLARGGDLFTETARAFGRQILAAVNYVRSAWGEEVFSADETSSENEMSVVQSAKISGQQIMLTGDTGRGGLAEAADFAPYAGITLPGINRFQVPHHGSRRNVSTDLLDRILGPRLAPGTQTDKFTAVISSAEADKDHPRKSVIRAMHHRGGIVVSTEGKTVCSGLNNPARAGWSAVAGLPYPEDQESE